MNSDVAVGILVLGFIFAIFVVFALIISSTISATRRNFREVAKRRKLDEEARRKIRDLRNSGEGLSSLPTGTRILRPSRLLRAVMDVGLSGALLDVLISQATQNATLDHLGDPTYSPAILGISGIPLDIPGLFAGIGFVTYLIYRRRLKQDQLALNQDAERISAGQPFLLYLRPFITSGRLLVRSNLLDVVDQAFMGRFWDFEFGLNVALANSKSLVAIGPSKRAIGAAKISTSEEDWRRVMLDLAARADAIVIVPFARPSTLWEVSQIADRPELLKKTIFVMPPRYYLRWRTLLFWQNNWRKMWRTAQSSLSQFGLSLPKYTRKGTFLVIGKESSLDAPMGNLDPTYVSELFERIGKASADTSDADQCIAELVSQGLPTAPRRRLRNGSASWWWTSIGPVGMAATFAISLLDILEKI